MSTSGSKGGQLIAELQATLAMIEERMSPIVPKVSAAMRAYEGVGFETFEESQHAVALLNAIKDCLGLEVVCPGTSTKATLRHKEAGRARTGVIEFRFRQNGKSVNRHGSTHWPIVTLRPRVVPGNSELKKSA